MATSAQELNTGIGATDVRENITTGQIWQVLGASSAGTVIEWYDFYIFGSLATTISPLFYPKGNDTLALIAFLSTFAVGFIVRPFGAIFFGRIGDLVGRKYAFLVTLLLMGGATAAVGFLPTFSQIGYAAPILLILVRVLQGLALGGEYGGATVYVAEHVPDNQRGYYTSFIQITASLGLLLSLAVIIGIQNSMTKEAFGADGFFSNGFIVGWRIPFMISIFLVLMSLYIRLRMKESPIFQHIKASGMASAKPLFDAFANPENRGRVLLSLFGATAGQGVVWYTGQFYALFYMQTVLKIERITASYIIAIGIGLAIPFFIIFGSLSDKIGRKKIMMAGCLLAVIFYLPIYYGMVYYAGNGVSRIQSVPDPITGEPKLTPVNENGLAVATVPVPTAPAVTPAPGTPPAIVAPGTPAPAATAPIVRPINTTMLTLLVFVQVLFVTMVYAPIAAYLVEAFPAKIRYTSMSLPYHIGNGVFGGLLPTIGLFACAYTGNIYAGLVYPMIIATITFIVGSLYLKETYQNRMWEEFENK
ncbi:MAG: MFS transporter [Pyrinomonadaceae bacterium]|nr:MFS transporter [Pyrinomonadaceae bacterium]